MAPEPRTGAELRVTVRTYSDRVRLRTEDRFQFIDLTELIAERVRRSGVQHGVVSVQTRHTTTAVIVNENEPMLLRDLKDLLERLAPEDAPYRHDDLRLRAVHPGSEERANGHAHARAAILGASESLNVVGGRLELGRWQRVFLVELDGPRTRWVSVAVFGSSRSGSNGSGTVWAQERVTRASAS